MLCGTQEQKISLLFGLLSNKGKKCVLKNQIEDFKNQTERNLQKE